jgi:hypothetical protein
MALPELIAVQADRALAAYCERRIPAHARHQVRMEYQRRGDAVTLIERRPVWDDAAAEWTAMPIARFRYEQNGGVWTLWCADRNGRWHRYEGARPTRRIEELLTALDRDSTGIFWG